MEEAKEIKQIVQDIYNEHKVKLNNMKDNLRSLDNPTDAEFNLIHEQIRILSAVLGDLFKKVLDKELQEQEQKIVNPDDYLEGEDLNKCDKYLLIRWVEKYAIIKGSIDRDTWPTLNRKSKKWLIATITELRASKDKKLNLWDN